MIGVEAQQARWSAHGDELLKLASSIFEEADLLETEYGATDPKVIAIALLCRTVGNFRGAMNMVDHGLVVEARALVRSCCENLIWMDALAQGGPEFVKQIVANEYKSKEMRGKVLAQWAASQQTKWPISEDLSAFLKSINGKAKNLINVKATAHSGVLKDTYIMYGQLSADAAHPSAESLSRHMRRGSDGSLTLIADALTDDAEKLQTQEFACSLLMGACVATNQILGGVPSGKKLHALFEHFLELRKTQTALVTAA